MKLRIIALAFLMNNSKGSTSSFVAVGRDCTAMMGDGHLYKFEHRDVVVMNRIQ